MKNNKGFSDYIFTYIVVVASAALICLVVCIFNIFKVLSRQ